MRKLCLIGLLMTLLWVTAGCANSGEEPLQTESPVNADVYYASGKKTVESAENLILEYTLEETRTVGNNTFTKQVTGSASYQGYAKAGMLAKVDQTLDFGYYRCSYGEWYCANKVYATINDSTFWANQSQEMFLSRQLPPVLLTPDLYDTITYGETKETVLFSDSRELEAWVGEGQLLASSGWARFSAEGQLLETAYEVRYRKGDTEYTLSATVQLAIPEQLNLSGTQEQNSVWLSDLDTPLRLVQVVADVYSAQNISCVLTENITSEAIPLSYNRNTDVQIHGRDETLSAEVSNSSQLSNNRGVITESSQTERFIDQTYQVSVGGSDPVQNPTVTAEMMRQYCEDTILSGLLAVKYLRSVSASADGNLLHLEMGGDLVFREMMTKHLQDVLQVDLDDLAEFSEHHRSGGYLTINLETGLPVELGMYMEKSHTIDGITYGLHYRLEETLTFS